MNDVEAFLEELPSIEWRSAKSLTPQAESLIDEFLLRIKKAVGHVMASKSLEFEEAFVAVLSVGGESESVSVRNRSAVHCYRYCELDRVAIALLPPRLFLDWFFELLASQVTRGASAAATSLYARCV